jgi:histidyl-tRNA synthetase
VKNFKPATGAEITEGETKTEVDFNACRLEWWGLHHQARITTIVNTLVSETRRPKVAKGVRDSNPIEMCIKNKAFNFIKTTFRKHGAVEIDTPVFELKETLMGKYGEEGGKLIYDLKDQGGELLSLRYDLTVPFARYCATNNVTKIKRFHIGKVWRRDQPNFNKGRFREFHQCDIDLAGPSGAMIADSEILTIANEVMSGLGIPNYDIKVCDRRLLEAVIEVAGADLERFKTICSSIDKLDKQPWSEIAVELIEEKGISKEIVDKLEPIV